MHDQPETPPTDLSFRDFPKLPRFARDCIITEKIDGTNACILIAPRAEVDPEELRKPTVPYLSVSIPSDEFREPEDEFIVIPGSRTRWIHKGDDNKGFARWVSDNRWDLMKLGPGRHFGEWWGSGIGRGYNLPKGEKRFSLFNVQRWCLSTDEPKLLRSGDPLAPAKYQDRLPACCGLVPVLWEGPFTAANAMMVTSLEHLRQEGSQAAPGFMRPEGVVVWHVAGNCGFKRTLEHDDVPKSAAPHLET